MTTTELATLDTTGAALALPPDPSDLAIARLIKQADAMQVAHKLGKAIADSDFAPKDYKGKPGNAAIAILYGAEIGISAIQSVQQIFIVYGRPAMYARTMVALLKAHGYRVTTMASSAESVTVEAKDPRTGEVETSTWTIERAKKAKYTSNEKYATNPEEMLYAKAASEVSRKLAPQVLLGITFSVEDLELEPRFVESQRVDQTAGLLSGEDILGDEATAAPAEAPSNPGAKQENPQANASEQAATEKPKTTRRKPADAPQATDAERPTVEQLKVLSDLLAGEGLATTEDKLMYLSEQLGRKITMPNQLTPAECEALTVFLSTAQARDAEKAGE